MRRDVVREAFGVALLVLPGGVRGLGLSFYFIFHSERIVGVRVWGLGFGVWGVGFRVRGVNFGVRVMT